MFLVMLGLLTTFPIVSAQEFSKVCSTGQTIQYRVQSDQTTVEVIGMDDVSSKSSVLNIPTIVAYGGRDYSVVSIGDEAFRGSELTSIIIPNSVQSIGAWAFANCWSIVSITIPNSVTTIGEYAFYDCGNIISLTIPNSISSIENSTFSECPKLKNLTIPSTVTSIGRNAFSKCYSLTAVSLPNSVITIDDEAFSNCENLSSIILPNSVTHVGEGAFSGCENLHSIYFPESVTSIGMGVCAGCNKLSSITIDVNNPVYDSRNNCNAIIESASNTLICGCGKTVVPNTVVSIGMAAFASCESLTSIIIPESVTSIGDYAFTRCYYLSSIKIPNNVSSIGADAFYKSGLTSVDLPNSIEVIRRETFGFCPFTSVTIPNSVTTIEEEAFQGCSLLTSVNIPNSVKYIGAVAFDRCSQLSSINIPNDVTYIGDGAFSRCEKLTSIYIPGSVTHIGNGICAGCQNLTSIVVDTSNSVYHSNNNSVIETATNTVIFSAAYNLLYGQWDLQEVQVPFGLEFYKIDSTDYDPFHYSLMFCVDGPVHEYNYPDRYPIYVERWDNCHIYNDSVLTLTKGLPVWMWQSYVIKKLTKDELILAYGYSLDGMYFYRYVRDGTLPIIHTKQNNTSENINDNPLVKRISSEEIAQNKTPAAVAYNLVISIFNSDTRGIMENLTSDVADEWEELRISEGYANFDSFFSGPEEKLNIKGWKEKLESGDYEIAVLFVQNEWFDKYGRVCKKVYVDCVPSSEVNVMGFQDITRDTGTNVKVLVVDDNGKWKAIGFK